MAIRAPSELIKIIDDALQKHQMLSTQANHALPLFPLLNLLSFCCKENNLKTSFHCLPFSPCTSLISPEYIFHQSAALPPLAAPAQIWKPTTAKMNTFLKMITFMTTAAAASVEIQVGSALLVSSTQQLEPNIGSQKSHFALQMAVAMKVSDNMKMVKIFLFLKHSLPQVMSPHQTTLTTTQTIWRRPTQ